MDEENIGRLQARLLRLAMNRTHLTLARVWWHYFSLGGDAVEIEVDAYLHDALHLPTSQRDLLAHAINELSGYERGFVAPYTRDLLRRRDERGSDDEPVCPDEEGIRRTEPITPGGRAAAGGLSHVPVPNRDRLLAS